MIDFKKIREEHSHISHELSKAEVIQNREKYTELSKRFSFLEKLVNLIDEREACLKQKKHFLEVIADTEEDEEIRDLAKAELENLKEKVKNIDEEMEDMIFEQSEPEHDIIIEIRAAAGGEEAALFVADLFRMYSRYIEGKKWKLEVLSSRPTEIGGFKELIFSVKGEGVWGHLKFESGVHRVQRVPITESGGRIHTSTVTVVVLIEPKEVELKINPEDLKIDTFRASGHGGQHVNVTDSAVRITHIPTGIVVSCQDERSQLKNREKAMRVIKARIMEDIMRKEAAKISEKRRTQIGTGERSEKIRTYNYPERRVTDHRVNLTLYRLEQILQGNLDEVVKKLIKEERKKIYEDKGMA